MSDDVRRIARGLKRYAEGLRAIEVRRVPRHRQASPPLPRAPAGGAKRDALAALVKQVEACQACSLYRTRTHAVVSDGDPDAKLVFIGEAPGRDEDLQGKPFVGAAGQLLTKMIEAMGFARQGVYICNVLKDRPPGNRLPEPDEIEACLPFLEQQLAIVQPKVICLLGSVAAKAILGPHVAITKVRGQVWDYHGTPVVPTFHPAYLLRNPPAKKFAWVDLKKVKQLLEDRG